MKIIFLDTEFTSLVEPYLVSAALVDEDGRSLYFELAGTSPTACTPFVIDHVLPLRDGPELRPIEIAQRVSDFFVRYTDANRCMPSGSPDDADVVLFCDTPRYDIELLKPFLPARLR